MILADTSVWIDHFREDLPELGERLRPGDVVMHPFIVGELACGDFRSVKKRLNFCNSCAP